MVNAPLKILSFFILSNEGMKKKALLALEALREKGFVQLSVPAWHYTRFEQTFGEYCPAHIHARAEVQRDGLVFKLLLEDANSLPF